jgi:tetratricopeptide (TPR) repeat protein
MHPPRHRNRRGWSAPLFRILDWFEYQWWGIKQFFGKVFNFRWVSAKFGGLMDRVWYAIRYPFWVMGWLMRQAWSVLVAWWQIRNFRYLIQGLPALIGIIFIIVIASYTWLRSDDGLQELYIRQATEARMRADRNRARLCYERLMQLQYVGDPRRLETQYHLGRLALDLNQRERSRSLLAELANPDNDDGYPDAHLEKAMGLLRSKPNKTNEDLDLIERHLRRALKKEPDHKTVNGVLGQVLANRGRFEEAIACLIKSDKRDVESRLTLARIYKAQGNTAQAMLYIDPLLDWLKSNAQGEIDDVRYRVTLASVYMELDDFTEAENVLKRAHDLKPSEFFRMTLSNCYVKWFEKLARMPPNPQREREMLERLIQAMNADSTNLIALKYFVRVMNTAGPDSDERRRALQLLLAMRGNNAYLHLYLGDKLSEEGKIDEARKEWDIAFKLNPNSSIIANNFAWILTHGSVQQVPVAPDLIKAERIINEVISRTADSDSNKPWFYGTRGTIYLKMGRYEDARADLVRASQRPDAINYLPLQQQLVEVYRALGMNTMEQTHRKIVADLIKRNSRTETTPEKQ